MFHELLINQLQMVASKISTQKDLESWVLANYQKILDSQEESAIRLAIELNNLFIEESERLISLEELEFTLLQVLQREESSVTFSIGNTPFYTEASSTVKKQLQVAGQV